MYSKEAFVQWLIQACNTINEMEAKAAMRIQAGDNAGYVEIMREKAFFLAHLASEGASMASALPQEKAERVMHRMEAFSASAQRALDLNSVFYMSALLFPENHTAGQPHDLALFVEEIAQTV